MEFLILFFPLCSAVIAGLSGHYIDKNITAILSVLSISSSCLLSIKSFFTLMASHNVIYLNLGNWIKVAQLQIYWGFLFDPLAVSMLVLVTLVSSCVHLYSWGYMGQDPHVRRFYAYLSLFTFFMLVLVTSDNYILLFLGWEGIGLCSYLLINFWFTRLQANKAALKALFVNRIGDLGYLIGLSAIFSVFGSLNFLSLFPKIPFYENIVFNFFNFGNINAITFICIFLFIGSIGKSAQIGLHVWLPDAMEGPTPVSALIHAATLVTAGVFLIIRSSPFFEFSPTALSFLIFIGALTSFFSSLIALVQHDLKKIIAYSTCSQLGYMVFACGISAYNVSLFHLFNHAFFKALLFLSAGSVIHALSGEQDIRKMGALYKIMPFSYISILIASLALAGFPFLSGFYSKDIILESAFLSNDLMGFFALSLGTVVTFFTGFYSFRLIYYVFWTKSNTFLKVSKFIHEPHLSMVIPMFSLGILSIFSGFLFKDVFIGMGSNFFDYSIYILPKNEKIVCVKLWNSLYTLIPIIFSLSGCFLGIYLNHLFSFNLWEKSQNELLNLFRFLNRASYFDGIYNNILKIYFLQEKTIGVLSIDKAIIEYFGPSGVSSLISTLSLSFSRYHTGYIYNYFCILALSFIFLSNLLI